MLGKKKSGRPKESADNLLRDINALIATLDETEWAHLEREAKCHRSLLRQKASHKRKDIDFLVLDEQ